MPILLSSSIIVNAYARMTMAGNLVLIEWEVVPEQTAERVAPTQSFRAHLWRSLDALLIAWKKNVLGHRLRDRTLRMETSTSKQID